MVRSPRFVSLAAALGCAVVLAACGGTEGDGDGAPQAAGAQPAAATEGPSGERGGSGAAEDAAATERPSATERRAEADGPGKADPQAPRLPDVTVTEIDGGAGVRLTDLAPSSRPLLVWFWAPHCPACAAEAPSIEAFAREHRDALTVVGLGAQDSLEEAEEFVAEHDVRTPQMLYDASFQSWAHFGINGQPAAILFDRDGAARKLWFGPIDEDEVLQQARALA